MQAWMNVVTAVRNWHESYREEPNMTRPRFVQLDAHHGDTTFGPDASRAMHAMRVMYHYVQGSMMSVEQLDAYRHLRQIGIAYRDEQTGRIVVSSGWLDLETGSVVGEPVLDEKERSVPGMTSGEMDAELVRLQHREDELVRELPAEIAQNVSLRDVRERIRALTAEATRRARRGETTSVEPTTGLRAITELLELIVLQHGGLPGDACANDPDDESTSTIMQGGRQVPGPMTFGHIRRAVAELHQLGIHLKGSRR